MTTGTPEFGSVGITQEAVAAPAVASNDTNYYGQNQLNSAPANPNEANISPEALLLNIQNVESEIRASMQRQGINPSDYQGVRLPSTQEMLANPQAAQSALIAAKHEAEMAKNNVEAKELQNNLGKGLAGLTGIALFGGAAAGDIAYNHPEGKTLAMLGVNPDGKNFSLASLGDLQPNPDLPNLGVSQQIAKNADNFKQIKIG